MGHSTDFTGVLTFVQPLTVPQYIALHAMQGEDCREHPEWHAPGGLYYIDLEVTEDGNGLRWDHSEKTYQLEKLVNVVLTVMREQWPDFGLTGELIAQGDEATDRWKLVIGPDGWAYKDNLVAPGRIVCCPHCQDYFRLDDTVQVVKE